MGKMSLIIVVGFNIIFMTMGFNLAGVASQSYNNYTKYYDVEQAQFLAESAANVSIGSLFQNQSWLYGDNGVHNHNLEGGTYSIQATRTYPNGAAYVTFNIISTYNGMVDSTTVVCNIPAFSSFAMYSSNDRGNAWSYGDTCWGKYHSDSTLTLSNTSGKYAYFTGSVTVGQSGSGAISGLPSDPSTVFKQGYTTGVKLGWVDQYDQVKSVPNYDSIYVGPITSWGSGSNKQYYQSDLYVQLYSDGTVDIDTGSHCVSDTAWARLKKHPSSAHQHFAISSMATHVLGIMGDSSLSNLHVRGILNGKLTIANLGMGDMYLDSSIVYHDTTKDLLGLVAKDTIKVTYDSVNNTGVFNLQAAVLASTFAVQYDENQANVNYYSNKLNLNTNTKNLSGNGTSDVRGNINLFGSLAQKYRGYVGYTSSSGSTNGTLFGFYKKYKYDNRFAGGGSNSAPSFPTLPYFQILSWYDRMAWSQNWWNIW